MIKTEDNGKVLVFADGTKAKHRLKADETCTVAEAYRAVVMDEMRDVPLDRLSRAGFYAAALVGNEEALGAVVLGKDYRPVGSRVFSRGEGGSPSEHLGDIRDWILSVRAEKVILCMSKEIDYVTATQFTRIISDLRANGVETVDLIEVTAHHSYCSIMKVYGGGAYPAGNK